MSDRITVVDQMYYQEFGEEPHLFETRFCRTLEGGGQPYERRLKADSNWKSLDIGWVSKVGMLSIRNEEGRFLLTNPTDEERKAAAARVLEVSYSADTEPSPQWLILPGESFRGLPFNASNLRIRCAVGEAKFTICVVPG